MTKQSPLISTIWASNGWHLKDVDHLECKVVLLSRSSLIFKCDVEWIYLTLECVGKFDKCPYAL